MKKLTISILIVLNGFLIWFVFDSIYTETRIIKSVYQRESDIKDKLLFIRQIQQVFKSQKGYYAADWTEIERYCEQDSIYSVSIKEHLITDKSTGIEVPIFERDTIFAVTVLDSLFKESFYKPLYLKYVPGFGKQYQFELKADVTDIQGVPTHVLQVLCPVEIDPRKKGFRLCFGSLEEPSLAGNWP